MILTRLVAPFLFLVGHFSLISQDGDEPWMRYPAISPDATTIAFSHRGDIWVVSTEGGRARQLTVNAAYEAYPVWSSDSKKVAFASNRYGNFDVFVVEAVGGNPTRLTYHSAHDYPSDFDQSDQQILFYSTRLDNKESLLFFGFSELYSVSVDGKRPKRVLSIPAKGAKADSAGRMLFEEVKGNEDEFRKHHTSAVTRDIWIADGGEFRQLTTYKGEDRSPVFGVDGSFYFLSERSGTFNVFKGSLSGGTEFNQVSQFENHPVRYLSRADNGTLCYSYNGAIYTQLEGEQPQQVEIRASGDDGLSTTELLAIGTDVDEFDVSPNAKEIAFIHRGEVFVSSVEGGMTRQITFTPEQERSLSYSPDGKSLLYAAERGNSWNLYLTRIKDKEGKYFTNAIEFEEEVILANQFETFQPQFSPDGKEVAFLEERTRLKKINVETKAITPIHDGSNSFSYADGDQHFQWSPDGKWFSVTFNPEEYWFSEVGLIKSDGTGVIQNLTKSGFYDFYPVWSRDGKMLYWMSDRHGAHSVAKTGSFELDVYAYFLTEEAYEDFLLSKGEIELSTKKEKDEEKKEEASKSTKKEKEEKKEEAKPIKIEWEGMQGRKARLTLFSSYISDMVIDKDSKNLYVLGNAESETELWKIDLRTKETKSVGEFGEDGGSLILNKEGTHLFIASDDGISKMDLDADESKPLLINGEMKVSSSMERLYLFDHVARQVSKKFLDPNLHGVDWPLMTNNYRRFVNGVNNNYDFRDILSELLGELNASHTGARWYPSMASADRTAAFGAYFDEDYDGAGIRILELMEKSPLITREKKIQPGVIIEAIDGTRIEPLMNYYPLLSRKASKPVTLSLFNPDKNERWKERIKPISRGEEFELAYQRWIKRNRAYVHELSGNKIGYMHVRDMSDRSFREFLEEAMGEEVNKEALIVDTRSNGGGDLVDDLTTWLSGENYMEFESRDGRVIGRESQRRWTKPSIMLIGEDNYSDAHCTPAAYKDLQIGKLIGMPVAGTCSFVWWERIQNEMIFGIPNMAVKDMAGDVLENKELLPDIQIKNGFTDIVNGKDAQIEAAVKELLEQIEE